MTVSVGGEIGEVGKENSTRRRAARVPRRLHGASWRSAAPGAKGLSKVSASRPAPATAACRCPAAAWRRSSSTSSVLRELGEIARSYGLAGAVQHGASTLPDELFHHFPAVETAEIHLATGFQNAAYDHPAFPAALKDEIHAWLRIERRGRAQGRPDRGAVPVHDAQEGDRAVQAPAVGARDEGRDPRRAGGQAGVPVHRAARQRVAGARPALHPAGRRSRGRSPSR